MASNFLANSINKFFWSLNIGYNPTKETYIRDRKGRFAKEPEVIKFVPIKRNFYLEGVNK